jgi:carbonic anhydrase
MSPVPLPQRSGDPGRPRKNLAVLTCMDARVDPVRALALGPRDAHVLRNAGGVATADVIESLAASQTGFGTRSIAVVHHTDCAGLALRLPHTPLEGSVRTTVRLLRAAAAIPHRDAVRGYVLDIATGTLTEVDTDPPKRAAPSGAEARREAVLSRAPRLARCRWCGRAFDPKGSSRRRGRADYCSELCRLTARAGGPAP